MVGDNLSLIVASFDDAQSAQAAHGVLKDAESTGDLKLVGSVVLTRDAQGKVHVNVSGDRAVPAGAVVGGLTGLVIGLFAPPLLLMVLGGAAVGAGIGELVKRHEETRIGVDYEEYLPRGSSAIAAVVDNTYVDRVEASLTKATKKVRKAVESGDYATVRKALEDAGITVADAIESA
jgi:uncharacterized membrane protein